MGQARIKASEIVDFECPMRALVSLLLTARHILTILFMFCFKLETPRCMNWTLALEHNRTILLRNVTWLFTWLKLEVGETVETLPRLNFWTVLFVLRPSESACRRLIYAAMFAVSYTHLTLPTNREV